MDVRPLPHRRRPLLPHDLPHPPRPLLKARQHLHRHPHLPRRAVHHRRRRAGHGHLRHLPQRGALADTDQSGCGYWDGDVRVYVDCGGRDAVCVCDTIVSALLL